MSRYRSLPDHQDDSNFKPREVPVPSRVRDPRNELWPSPGPDYWSGTRDRELLPVVTPIDGSVIPRVALAPESDYEHVVKTAQENFLKWRMTRAPVRGQVVREKIRLRHLWWNRQHLIAEF